MTAICLRTAALTAVFRVLLLDMRRFFKEVDVIADFERIMLNIAPKGFVAETFLVVPACIKVLLGFAASAMDFVF